MSVFSRLLLLMIAVGVAPLVPTGALLLYHQKHAKSDALNVHASISEITATGITQYMETLAGRLAFSVSIEKHMAANDKAKTEAVLRDAIRANPDFLLAAVLDGQGHEQVKVGTDLMFRRFGYLDRSADPVFVQAKKTGRVVLSNFEAQYGMPIATLACPLQGGRYLFMIVSFARLWASIQAQTIGATGRIFLADSRGRVFHFAGDMPPNINPRFLQHMFNRPVNKFERIRASEGVFAGACSRVPGTNLFVLTLQSRDEAFWALKMMNRLILFFILATGTASYFAALFFARKLGEPVLELINGASRVSGNNFDVAVDARKGWGELSGLMAAFNSMMSAMKKYNELQVDKILEEKRKVDLLLRLMPDGVILADAEGRPLFINDTAALVLKTGVLDDGAANPDNAIRELSSGAFKDKTIKARLPGRSGPAYYKVSLEKFEPARSAPLSVIVLRDISLEHEIDAMKEDFFNSIAHDLRAPLLGIQGYVKMLEQGCSGAQAKEYLAGLERSNEKLFKLVEDILDIAKMESGAVRLKLEKFSVEECVDNAFKVLLPAAEAKNITLSTNGRLPGPVAADARLIERVIYNLAANAIKFTPQGGKITVEYSALPLGHQISVEDTGPGIPADKLAEVFEKYRQLRGPEESKGYGMGLAIAKKIVELHGGKIWAEARQGSGARLVFFLPEREI